MPAPPERRQADLDAALRLMATQTGDRYFDEVYWTTPTDAELAKLLPTTLPELEEMGFVRREDMLGEATDWYLTAYGWAEGLRRAGHLNESAFRQRVYRLVACLDDKVDRRNPDESILEPGEVAADASLPDGWILNVLASGLLEELISDKLMNARYQSSDGSIRLPPTFGMQRR